MQTTSMTKRHRKNQTRARFVDLLTGTSKHKRNKGRSLKVESLETRRLMSADGLGLAVETESTSSVDALIALPATTQFPPVPSTANQQYAHDSDGTLFSVDVATGNTDVIGQMPHVMYDITFDNQGGLYGVDSNGGFHAINPLTAQTSFIGSTGVFINALEVSPTGEMFAAGGSTLYKLNPLNGSPTTVGSMNGFQSNGDLAFDQSGRLLMAAKGDWLVDVDPQNAAASLVGKIDAGVGSLNVLGLDFGDNDTLYGFSDNRESMLQINPNTGQASELLNLTHSAINGVYGATYYQNKTANVDLSGWWTTVDFESESSHWGDIITLNRVQISNTGSDPSGDFSLQWYLSTDPNGSSDDVLLSLPDGATSFSHASVSGNSNGPLFTTDLQLPGSNPFQGSNFYIITKSDAFDTVVETNEDNNFGDLPLTYDNDNITITSASSGGRFFTHDRDGTLLTVDVATGNTEVIGQMPQVMFDITFDNKGDLYGVASGGGFYKIDPLTAQTTLIGSTGVFVNALEVSLEGEIFGAGTNSLYKINPSTGSATLVGRTGNYQSSGDLAFDSSGRLLMSAHGDLLIEVDPQTAAASLVGNIDAGVGTLGVYGLDYSSDGMLYGFSNRRESILQINPNTGQATEVMNVTHSAVDGLYGATYYGYDHTPDVDLSGWWITVASDDEESQWGDMITLSLVQISNTGSDPSGSFDVQWYLSTDPNGSDDDVLLNQASGATSYSHDSIPGGSYGSAFSVDLQLPDSNPFEGTEFYVITKSDADDAVVETSEDNNFGDLPLTYDNDHITITTPSSGGKFFAHDSDGTLISVDVASGNTNVIGQMSHVMYDITFDKQDVLYGVDSNGGFHTINPATAQTSFIGNTGVFVNALEVSPAGEIYAAGNNLLYKINPTNGSATTIGRMGNYQSNGDLAFDSSGRLLMAAEGDFLVEVNPQTAATALIGKIDAGVGQLGVLGLDFTDDDKLYGFSDTRETVLQINPNSGQATEVMNLTPSAIHGVYGATYHGYGQSIDVDLSGWWTTVAYASENSQWGDVITLNRVQIANTGSDASGNFALQWYLSTDPNGSNDDVLLKQVSGATSYAHSTIAGGSYGPLFSVDLQLPSSNPFAGTEFYVITKTDADDQVIETSEDNNFGDLPLTYDNDNLTIAAPTSSGGQFYAHDSDGTLFNVDVATGNTEVIGQMPQVMYDITFDKQGVLYGVDSIGGFYGINPATAETSLIGWTGVFINALEVSPAGEIFAAGGSTLYKVNPLNGSVTVIGNTGGYQSNGDLAFDNSGRLLMAAQGDLLVEVDPQTAAATLIGAIDAGVGQLGVLGLDFSNDGTLYGFSDVRETILQIDPNTGQATEVVNLTHSAINGTYGATYYKNDIVITPVSNPVSTLAVDSLFSDFSDLGVLF